MNIKLKRLLISLAIILSLGGLQVVYAHFISSDERVNSFEVGSVDVEIKEDCFVENQEWVVGKEICKEVKIQSHSQAKTLIRVQVIPYWIDEDNQPFAGDVSAIVLNFDDNHVVNSPSGANQWVKGEDGFYYYSSTLEFEALTTTLLKSVTLSKALPESYRNKKIMVDVEVEAIQASKNAYQAAWPSVGTQEAINKMLEALCLF